MFFLFDWGFVVCLVLVNLDCWWCVLGGWWCYYFDVSIDCCVDCFCLGYGNCIISGLVFFVGYFVFLCLDIVLYGYKLIVWFCFVLLVV